MSEGTKLIAQNKKARFNYSIEDTYECGIELQGTEVKSFKNGNISFPDAFAEIIKNEVWVKNLHISEYTFSSIFNHNPDRPKKLLLHKEEIRKLQKKIDQQGYTLVPTKLYLKEGLAKIEIALARGKKMYDKRETIKENDIKREIAKNVKGRSY